MKAGLIRKIIFKGEKMRILKVVLMVLAFILMFAVVLFIDDVSIIDVMAGSFFLVVNGFLGVDLAAMIKNTSEMNRGDFQFMKMYRYIIVLCMMLILFGLSIYRKEADGIQIVMAVSTFGGGAMVTIGMMLAGLEGNKIASRVDG